MKKRIDLPGGGEAVMEDDGTCSYVRTPVTMMDEGEPAKPAEQTPFERRIAEEFQGQPKQTPRDDYIKRTNAAWKPQQPKGK